MSMFGKGHFKSAWSSMRLNRGRSFLTMLGVIVGVASVILVVGIGQGVKQQVGNQVNQYSKNVITIRPAQLGSATSSDNPLSAFNSFNVTGALTAKDVSTVSKIPGVSVSVPVSIIAGNVKGDAAAKDTVVIGTSQSLPDVISQSLAYGVFFLNDDANSKVAVLGAHAATELFNQDIPLGRSFTLRGQEFVVRGVLDSFINNPFSSDTNFNNAIFIPSKVAANLTGNNAPIYEILAKVQSSHDVPTTAAMINKQLLKLHGGQADFSVQQPSQAVKNTSGVLNVLTEMIGGVAAISLLVGGIGIMNVMLVSVTERMHEIGIRKAIGATNRQILNQFMVEATMLSVTGCVIGIIVAFVSDLGLHLFTSLTPAIGWQVVAIAVGVSLLVGVVFGSVPALKAARKDPIDALRNE